MIIAILLHAAHFVNARRVEGAGRDGSDG